MKCDPLKFRRLYKHLNINYMYNAYLLFRRQATTGDFCTGIEAILSQNPVLVRTIIYAV